MFDVSYTETIGWIKYALHWFIYENFVFEDKLIFVFVLGDVRCDIRPSFVIISDKF